VNITDTISWMIQINQLRDSYPPDSREYAILSRMQTVNFDFLERGLNEVDGPPSPPPFKLHTVT
jgi:hypothetical protein